MKKKIALTIFLLITMIATTVFASAKSTDVSMEVVKGNTIRRNDVSNRQF